MKKIVLLLLFLLSCHLTACSPERSGERPPETVEENAFGSLEATAGSASPVPAGMEEKTEAEGETATETETRKEIFSVCGVSVRLPANTGWIQDVEYEQSDDDRLEIYYHDGIIDGDCILLAAREEISDFSDMRYDGTAEETWVGDTASGQTVYVRVRHLADGTAAVATWEYQDCHFAVWGNVPDATADTNSIPKTALFVIGGFDLQ